MTQKIYSQRLPNGLTLVAEEMDWLESAAFSLQVPAGCSREASSLAGLANLTVEMVERGAGSRDSRRFVADLENLGADCSSSSSIANTSFGGAMPAESLLPALSIYADVVRRPHLPEDQLEDARQTCLQEVRALEDDQAQKLMQELRRRFYGDPWGRSCQGTLESVGSLQLSDVKNFFAAAYRPQEAVLSVAGKINWPQLQAHAETIFGDWKAGEVPTNPEKSLAQAYTHLEADSSQTHIGIAFPGESYSQPNYFQLRGAIGVLSDGMSSRLFTEVREKRGLVYTVYATCHSLRQRGSVFAYAGTTSERAQETLEVMLAELKRLAQGVEKGELDRLKGRIKRALILQQESSPSRAGNIASDWYYLSRVRTMQELSQLVDGLTCDTINAYLAAHPPANFTIVTVGKQPLQVS